MWDLPRPGLEPVSLALAGRLSTTAPPGKPCHGILCQLPEARSLMFPFLPYAGDCQGFLELLKSQSLQREAGTLSALSKARRTEVGTRGLSVESPRHGSGALQQRPPQPHPLEFGRFRHGQRLLITSFVQPIDGGPVHTGCA